MPLNISVLRANITDFVDEAITVRLHTGDPGTSGTDNRVTAGITVPTIAATSGWTVHGTLARAENAAAIEFGTATQAVTGVSHYSLLKGSAVVAQDALSAAMDIPLGAPVRIAAGELVVTYTST